MRYSAGDSLSRVGAVALSSFLLQHGGIASVEVKSPSIILKPHSRAERLLLSTGSLTEPFTATRAEADRYLPAESPVLGSIDQKRRVERLLEDGRFQEARQLAAELQELGLAPAGGWADLLKPGAVRTSPASCRGDFSENMAWLSANRSSFGGRWVALRDGHVLDSDQQLKSLVQRLRQAGLAANALLVRA